MADADGHQQVPAQHRGEHPHAVGELHAGRGAFARQQGEQAGIEQGVLGVQDARAEAGGEAPRPGGRGPAAAGAGGPQRGIGGAGVPDEQDAQVAQVQAAGGLQRMEQRAVRAQRGEAADGQRDEHPVGRRDAQAGGGRLAPAMQQRAAHDQEKVGSGAEQRQEMRARHHDELLPRKCHVAPR